MKKNTSYEKMLRFKLGDICVVNNCHFSHKTNTFSFLNENVKKGKLFFFSFEPSSVTINGNYYTDKKILDDQ